MNADPDFDFEGISVGALLFDLRQHCEEKAADLKASGHSDQADQWAKLFALLDIPCHHSTTNRL